jgi:hypothetical protein
MAEKELELFLQEKYPQNTVKLLSKPSVANVWNSEEDETLLCLCHNLGTRQWKTISKYLPGRSNMQCSSRYKRIKPGIIKGTWSKKEDKQLRELVNIYGRKWSKINKIMISRSGKQIRERYLNILQPGINKNKFSLQEDQIIIQKYEELGTKWHEIANFLPNRTGDKIKNRFYSTLRKKYYNIDYLRQKSLRKKVELPEKQIIEVFSKEKTLSKNKRNSNKNKNVILSNSSLNIISNKTTDSTFKDISN